MEFNLVNAMSRETALRNYLSEVKDKYDYILIDCIQKEGYSQSNPTVAKTDKNPPSRHDSEPVDMQTDKGTVSDRQRKPSVKAKLDRYKAQSKQQKEAERKEPEVSKPEVKKAPAQTVHQQPKPKSKNVKER